MNAVCKVSRVRGGAAGGSVNAIGSWSESLFMRFHVRSFHFLIRPASTIRIITWSNCRCQGANLFRAQVTLQ